MSVQFDGNQMMFDFIQLDLSGNQSIDPEFITKIDYGQFEPTDASAIGLLNVDKLNGIFWYKISNRDLSDDNDTLFAMSPDNWPYLYYSNSRVTPDTAISRFVTDVTISEDFVRSIIRDIMGNIGFNCLFSNLEEMKQDVVNLDILFDTLIRNKINIVGGTFNNPKHLYDISPAGHLWNGIINQEDGSDERRVWFMDKINKKRFDYEKMYENVAFYYYGNDGIHGEGYYYPLYLSQNPGSEIIQFSDDIIFYIVGNKKGVPFIETNGLIDYREYINPYFPMEFLKDDILKIRLTYHHSQQIIYNKTIHPRSYMLYLKLV